MFGWLKNRLLKRMQGLTEMALLATYMALSNSIEDGESKPEAERQFNSTKAAAQANFLFDRSVCEAHEAQLDLSTEHTMALRWVAKQPTFCELVVQSLRSINVIAHAQNPSRSPRIIGQEVLENFGKRYPEVLSPEAYEALLMRAIEALPEPQQIEIKQWQRTRR